MPVDTNPINKITLKKYDLICVGGGIMSATLALMLKLLDPQKSILILEKLDKLSMESSAAWNNSGTGHSAFCELNYTPQREDGTIDVTKALNIFTQYERSKEFWAFLVEQGMIEDPASFIRSVPHHSWVRGEDDVNFLRKRYEAMRELTPFRNMKYSEEYEIMNKWFPLIMEGRDPEEVMAATRMEMGTEVNFKTLTISFFKILEERFNTPILTSHEVLDIDPERGNDWLVEAQNLDTGKKMIYDADHVFIGAGGGALPLLQKVEIEEKDGYGGFPVSGQWLICNNEEIINQHHAKVYSKAGVDAPPMSTPHLDTRFIKGKRELLFGPFAGFSTKFLKSGSLLDLPKAVRFDNLPSYWGVFWHNIPLTKYLLGQITMGHEDRMQELRKFVKNARAEDWELKVAGQRVQVIKRDEKEGGILEFGTDVVHSKDGSITALLGASPGASTAVHIMLKVLEIVYPEKYNSPAWKEKLDQMIPNWKRDITGENKKFLEVQNKCSRLLNLDVPGVQNTPK